MQHNELKPNYDPALIHDADLWFDIPVETREANKRARHDHSEEQSSLHLNVVVPVDAPLEISKRQAKQQRRIVFLSSFLLYLVSGQWLLTLGLFNPDNEAAFSRANQIWQTGSLKIDIANPPFETFMYIPFAWSKTFLHESMLVMPTALVGAAAITVIWSILANMRISKIKSLLVLGAILTNPAWILVSSTGSQALIGVTCLLVGFYGMLVWLHYDTISWAIVSSLLMSVGILTWYPLAEWALLFPLALIISVAMRKGNYAEIQGRLLMFIAPIAYTAFLAFAFGYKTKASMPSFGSDSNLLDFSNVPTFIALGLFALAFLISYVFYVKQRGRSTGSILLTFIFVPVAYLVARTLINPGALAGLENVLFITIPIAALLALSAVWFFQTGKQKKMILVSMMVLLLSGNATLGYAVIKENPKTTSVLVKSLP